MPRIPRADRLVIENTLTPLEASLEALHDPADHEGADSELAGVMKCKGCEQRLQLRRVLDHRLTKKDGVFVWKLGIERTEALPPNAASVLNGIATASPGNSGRINAIKGKLGL